MSNAQHPVGPWCRDTLNAIDDQHIQRAQDQHVRDAARSLCERFYEGLPIDVAVGNLQAELDKGTRW